MNDQIILQNARLHNLKNISLSIPKNRLVVFTGLSGSGKSTLAFDILHKEGQRQYLESLGLVADSLTRPPVDSIRGLSPTISVDQNLTNRSPRSTVGTATEVFTYLRVLFARLGVRSCPQCGTEIPPSFDIDANGAWDDAGGVEAMGGEVMGDEAEGEELGPSYPCPNCGALIPEMSMASFSFNKPAGACPTCTGLGTVFQPNLDRLIDKDRSIQEGAITGWDPFFINHNSKTLLAAGKRYGFPFDPTLPVKDYGPIQRDLLLYGVESPQFRRHFPDVDPPTTVRQGRFEGIVTNLLRRHAEHANNSDYLQKVERFLIVQTCPDCQGTRLRAESRAVTVAGRTIVELSRLPLIQLAEWLNALPDGLPAEAMLVAEPVLDDLHRRVQRLVDVGVGYLNMERASPTLSAGEGQRLRLASLLGSGLTGVLYVLDEPTIGLHPRDNQRLIRVLRQLRDLGNTVLVIEHDLEMVAAADFVVDIGPGAGKDGGRVVAVGAPAELANFTESITGAFLSHRQSIPLPARRREPGARKLTIRGAREHNLKDIDAEFPLGMLVAVTGVSGSGKSTLMFDILDRVARQRFYGASERPGAHDAIQGWEHIDRIITIDQTPIGRTPRSNAATYTDAFTSIRNAFAATPQAQESGLSAGHFSFNVAGGRCERCQGAGVLTVNMHFMPDVQVRCPVCRGRRFRREVLAVKYKGWSIADVLNMTIEEAMPIFEEVPAAASRLGLMVDVGLGYLQLGQPATTLSGGEAQRVKLAKELARRGNGHTLYLLDEPSTGLHAADTARLLALLHRLVEADNTVIVIEHNLELIKTADWIIDLGPEGGEGGGQILVQGSPEQVARAANSQTGAFLRPLLVIKDDAPV